jgi:lysylphosphatidylglycerol synthase-like protein
LNWWYFVLGAVMFAVFLFAFRVLSWWRILDGFGHRLPLAPATRIWSISELARYLPGMIWQVVGRVLLIKPYGVNASVCSTSQILELTIFLLANLLVALACLVWLGIKLEPRLRPLLLGALALVPVLLVFLHPKVFYGIFDRVMRRLGKPVIEQRLKKRQLFGLGVWAILGLLWQSLAIWAVVHDPLQLQFTKWWVVAGSYCLAWCAGFLAFWAPGGLGVREAVFMMAMGAALPSPVRHQFADHVVLAGFLAFLAVLLRLWVTTGELLLAAVAYALDSKRRGRVEMCEIEPSHA